MKQVVRKSFSVLCAMTAVAVTLGVSAQVLAQSAVTAPTEAPATNGAALPESSLGLTQAAGTLSEDQLPPEIRILKNIEKEIKKNKGKEIYERSSVPSLVFTPSQYALLREARIGFNTRTPTSQELRMGDPNDPNYRPPAAIRDVALGGIAFESPDDWTIWLNGKRVTPDALPSEALDLRVYRDFIELKWFDSRSNQVFPIRLRPSQKFNLDTRVFLPG